MLENVNSESMKECLKYTEMGDQKININGYFAVTGVRYSFQHLFLNAFKEYIYIKSN